MKPVKQFELAWLLRQRKNVFACVRDKTAEQNVSKKAVEFETSG